MVRPVSCRGFQKGFQRGFKSFLELCVCIKILNLGDPCCGSGGFFLAAQAFLADPKNYALDTEQKKFVKNEIFYGNELVPATFKLCLMNLYLHNIGDIYGKVPVTWSEDNPDGRWRKFDVAEILERDKTSLDIFWIKDKSLADLDSLPSPDLLADEIIENLLSALESFQELRMQLK